MTRAATETLGQLLPTQDPSSRVALDRSSIFLLRDATRHQSMALILPPPQWLPDPRTCPPRAEDRVPDVSVR